MKTLFKTETAPAAQELSRNRAETAPDVNIYENKEGYLLEAEMPGVNKDGLEITLEGHELTIIGRPTEDSSKGEPLVRERTMAEYRRSFELDPAIDTARISARMNQGVLFLTLPKSEAVKPRKIIVQE